MHVMLKFDVANRHHVTTLRCYVCAQFQTQLESMRNSKPVFIDGTINVSMYTVKDNAGTVSSSDATV